MSLQIPIQKDIGEYEEKIVGKLSLRTLICVTLGFASTIATAAVIYFWLGMDVSNAAFPVMCASLPFWLAGFWRPFGMRLEKFIPRFASHHLDEQTLLYRSDPDPSCPPMKAGKPSRRSRRAANRKGAELREPTKQQEQEAAAG